MHTRSRRVEMPSGRSLPLAFGINTRLRSEEHTSELQSRLHLVCRLLLEKKNAYAPVATHVNSSRNTLYEAPWSTDGRRTNDHLSLREELNLSDARPTLHVTAVKSVSCLEP